MWKAPKADSWHKRINVSMERRSLIRQKKSSTEEYKEKNKTDWAVYEQRSQDNYQQWENHFLFACYIQLVAGMNTTEHKYSRSESNDLETQPCTTYIYSNVLYDIRLPTR